MAKFCSQCGRPLADGEICNCTQEKGAETNSAETNNTQTENAETNNAQTENMQTSSTGADNAQAGGTQNNTAAAAKEAAKNAADNGVKYAKNVFSKIGPMFKDPIGEIKRMADADKLDEPMALVITHIIVAFVLSVIAMIALRVKLGEWAKWVDIPYVRIVVLVTIIAAALDFINAGVMLLSSKCIFKENTTFAKTLSITGGPLLIQSVIIVVGVVLMIINSTLGMLVFALGGIFTLFVQTMSFYEISTQSTSKKLYSYAVYYVIYIVCIVILYYLVIGMLGDSGSFINYLF